MSKADELRYSTEFVTGLLALFRDNSYVTVSLLLQGPPESEQDQDPTDRFLNQLKTSDDLDRLEKLYDSIAPNEAPSIKEKIHFKLEQLRANHKPAHQMGDSSGELANVLGHELTH